MSLAISATQSTVAIRVQGFFYNIEPLNPGVLSTQPHGTVGKTGDIAFPLIAAKTAPLGKPPLVFFLCIDGLEEDMKPSKNMAT